MAETRKGKRGRRSDGDWGALLWRHRSSGLSVAEFCRREAVSTASFYRWRSILDGEQERGATGGAAAPAFVDLGALNAAPSTRARLELKLDLGDGLVLHVVRG